MNKSVLITGASRGIGLALAERFLAAGWHVHAACRNPDGARCLWELEHRYPDRARLHGMDVTTGADCDRLAATLAGRPLDMLVNNAGIALGWQTPLEEIPEADFLRSFDVNALGPLRVTRALLPLLKSAPQPVVATITSGAGSITDTTTAEAWAYRMSKAAANMFARTLAAAEPGLTSVALCPGWVRTDMGGPEADLSVAESSAALLRTLTALTPDDTGRFIGIDGEPIPW